MKSKYENWISDYLDRTEFVLGECKKATQEMKEAFPELEIVKGHVYTSWGRRGHWWLTGPDGDVVDPTVTQFGVVFEYEPWEPGGEVYVGKCMNCGEEVWQCVDSLDVDHRLGFSGVCSALCEREMIASLG